MYYVTLDSVIFAPVTLYMENWINIVILDGTSALGHGEPRLAGELGDEWESSPQTLASHPVTVDRFSEIIDHGSYN